MKKELVFNLMWSFTENKICFNMGLSEFESMSKLSKLEFYRSFHSE